MSLLGVVSRDWACILAAELKQYSCCRLTNWSPLLRYGTQGAGKSTLTAAIFRLAELYAGTISVDDVNLADIQLHEVRGRAVCLMAQESLLFSGTVRYCIAHC